MSNKGIDPKKEIKRLERERKRREEDEKRKAKGVKKGIVDLSEKDTIVRIFKKITSSRKNTLKDAINEFRLLSIQKPSLGHVREVIERISEGTNNVGFVNTMKLFIKFFELPENLNQTIDACADKFEAGRPSSILSTILDSTENPDLNELPQEMPPPPVMRATRHQPENQYPQEMPKKELTECIKVYRAAPWVSVDQNERVLKTEIQPADIDGTEEGEWVLARPNFFSILCNHTHTVSDKNVLEIKRCSYMNCMCHELWLHYNVRYLMLNISTKKKRYIPLDPSIFKRREMYNIEHFGEIKDKVTKFAKVSLKDHEKEATSVALMYFKNKAFGKRVTRFLGQVDTVIEFFTLVASFVAYMVVSEDGNMETPFMSLTRRGISTMDYVEKLYNMEPSDKLKSKVVPILEYYKEMEEHYALSMCLSFYLMTHHGDRFQHIYVPPIPKEGLALLPKENNPYPPEDKEIKLADYVPKVGAKSLAMSIFSIYSYLNAAINDVFGTASRNPNMCHICDTNICESVYKTINIGEDEIPEVVKFCSSKCMDNHEEYEFE